MTPHDNIVTIDFAGGELNEFALLSTGCNSVAPL